MTFLDFPPETSKKSSKSPNLSKLNVSSSPADRILIGVPPKIEPVRSSDVLSRAAAFLPQLAASNRAILQKRPEDVNIEILNGKEGQIIEMKLGLGVFEENRSDSEESSTSESEDDPTATGIRKKRSRNIIILPSELRAAAEAKKDTTDSFEKVINSLLLFDGSTDEDDEEMDSADSEITDDSNVLEFQ